jgi:hypothetical protein
MTSKLRFIKQEHPDTCAVACLRMLLAARGLDVAEVELVQAAGMQVWFIYICRRAWMGSMWAARRAG